MYRALGKKTAAKEEGRRDWDEDTGLNAHDQHGYKDAYFLLGNKEIPEGPEKPFANQEQALDLSWVQQLLDHSLPIGLSSHKSPGFCYWREYQNKLPKISEDFALDAFQCFPHPGISKLGNMWHHQSFCTVHHCSN